MPEPTPALGEDDGDASSGGQSPETLPVDLDSVCIEPLNDLHRRDGFRCKDGGIERFCRGHIASQHRIGMIRAFVATLAGSPEVIGFYYLLTTSIEPELLGPEIGGAEFVYVHKVPAVYLGMIGVHEPLMREGIGGVLMIHAFRMVAELGKVAGVWALTLDAIDEDAAAYYERFDFRRFSPGGKEMYLPLGTLLGALEELEAAGNP